MSGVRIPAELHAEFERFRRDFDAVWVQWVADGVENEATRKHARGELAEWFARIQGEPDQAERLRAVFAYWGALAGERNRAGSGLVAVRPVTSGPIDPKRVFRC